MIDKTLYKDKPAGDKWRSWILHHDLNAFCLESSDKNLWKWSNNYGKGHWKDNDVKWWNTCPLCILFLKYEIVMDSSCICVCISFITFYRRVRMRDGDGGDGKSLFPFFDFQCFLSSIFWQQSLKMVKNEL